MARNPRLGFRCLEADNSEQPAGVDRAQCLNGPCGALKYLHSRTPSIVRGNIKAGNIRIEQHWDGSRAGISSWPLPPAIIVNAKLMDFGLSRMRKCWMKPLAAHIGG